MVSLQGMHVWLPASIANQAVKALHGRHGMLLCGIWALGQQTCVTVKTVVPADLLEMLKTDCSEKTTLAMHTPSSSRVDKPTSFH